MKTKVLITGATGFVGSHLTRRLVQNDWEVHILVRKTSNKWRLADVLDRVKEHEVDLLDKEALGTTVQKIKPEVIFHLANLGLYGGVSSPPGELVKANLLGLVNLTSALDEINYRKFVNIGSSSEYGPKDNPMKESNVCEPLNIYGVTKLAATRYASSVAKTENKPITTFRLFSPFGPYDDDRRLISKVILDLLANRELSLANPEAVRDYIFVDDVIDLLLEVVEEENTTSGEVFNVGTGEEHKIKEIVQIITDIINPRAKVRWDTVQPKPWESKKWEADMSKTFSTFKWRPKHSMESGITKTVEWFKKHQNLFHLKSQK